MTNPLIGCRIKISRAKKHLADLKAAVDAFDALHPYSLTTDKAPRYEIHRFWLNAPIPVEWGAILGDCIHNLRSSLDLLAVELITINGGTPSDYSAFPISPDERHFEARGVPRLNGASARAIEFVRRLKPYRGDGNNTLWELHRLDIADKTIAVMLDFMHPVRTRGGLGGTGREARLDEAGRGRTRRGTIRAR
jgi:hypothetical protein